MENEVKKITEDMNESRLLEDLEKYLEQSITWGADRTRLVETGEISVKEAVARKCQIPRCWGYGKGANCPPHALKPSELKETLKGYKWAVFFARNIPTELLLRDRTDKERIAAYRSIYDIARKIESQAFYDGHYLAFGLAAGSCKGTLCWEHDRCQALEEGTCRFPLLARPSMEAVGIDVYRLAASSGWDIYPIGSHGKVEDAPNGMLAGIVIVQ